VVLVVSYFISGIETHQSCSLGLSYNKDKNYFLLQAVPLPAFGVVIWMILTGMR
jgi:hypothetical protein